jgi:hypothetical protein
MASPPPLRTWRELILWLAEEYHGGTLYQMARHLRRSSALLYQWRDGQTEHPDLTSIKLIVTTYGLDTATVMALALGSRAWPVAEENGARVMNGWTDGEDKYMADARGEQPWDQPDEPEEVEPEPAVKEQDTTMSVPVRVVSCADCGKELFRYRLDVSGTVGYPTEQHLTHECAAQGRANRAARRRA